MASKRPVAPDTPIRSFPTPNISDLVVSIDVDSRLPGYKPLEYGTLHPDQTKFPGAKLVYQEPVTSRDGVSDKFVRRIYVTDRFNQDAYNYATSYSSESPSHPIIIRSYVEPRDSYVPLDKGEADPFVSNAYLVSEKVSPVEGDLSSLYVNVIRTFETLPGPAVVSYKTNDAGQVVTVSSQRKASLGYKFPSASATSAPSATAENVHVFTEEITTVPQLFAAKIFSAERPDPLPTKFRAAVPDVETNEIVEGEAQQPTLNVPTDLSASERQETIFTKRVSRRLRPNPTYPVTFTETTRTNKGQLATVTSTLQDFIQEADTGSLVESSEVTDLGDGRSIKVTAEVDELFSNVEYSAERPDVIPTAFRDQVPTTTVTEELEGTAAPVTLTGDEIAKSEQQLTTDTIRSRVTTRSGALTTESLTGHAISGEYGVAEIVTDELVAPGTLPNLGGLVVADEIEPLSSTVSRRTRRTLTSHPEPYDYYEVTQDKGVVKNTVEFYTRATLPVPLIQGATVDISDTPLAFPWVRRTTKTLPLDPDTGLPILPPSRVEWDEITYTFPGIIYTWKAKYSKDTKRANLSFFENRYPVTMSVAAKAVVTYHHTAPDLSSLPFYRVITRPWAQIFFNIPDNTIHPPAPLVLAKESVDRGGVAFDIQGGQSSEPAVYTPGDTLLISGSVKQWWGDFFVQRLVYVQEPV